MKKTDMLILPAIDLYDKKAVRLYKGDYNEMTVYSNNPIEIARKFQECGAEFIHMVDLEGAKNGTTPNIDEVRKVVEYTDLKVEIGGGIRDEETVQKYIDLGVERVILGTAAVTDDEFLRKMLPIPDHMNILCAVAIGYTTFSPAALPEWDKEAHVHRL